VKRVVIHDRHHSALPVIAGGLIGSAIGHDIGHGDPAATFGGAIFGAMIGDAVSRH
jgi:outer membrane lipoprotein SlyB